jgi:hypothetical protein
MRHYFAAGAVASLAGRVAEPAGTTLLIQPPGAPQRDAARVGGARPRAVALPTVADPAQVEEALAVWPDTDDQPQRIHTPPRSERGLAHPQFRGGLRARWKAKTERR